MTTHDILGDVIEPSKTYVSAGKLGMVPVTTEGVRDILSKYIATKFDLDNARRTARGFERKRIQICVCAICQKETEYSGWGQ